LKNLQESGPLTDTFESTTLPETMMIGYERVKVRPHTPRPLKCRNCLKLGHPTKACKKPKICTNECDKQKFNHSIVDKKCHSFINQKEITTIRTLQKVDHKTSTRIYNMLHIHQSTPYSKITYLHQNPLSKSKINQTEQSL